MLGPLPPLSAPSDRSGCVREVLYRPRPAARVTCNLRPTTTTTEEARDAPRFDETREGPPPWVVGRGEGFVAAVAARYGPEAGAAAAAHLRRGDTRKRWPRWSRVTPGSPATFAQAEECDRVAARVRAMAEREGPEWIAAEEAASIVADAEEVAERIRRRVQDGLDGGA